MSLEWKNCCRICASVNGNKFDISVNLDAITEFKSFIHTQHNIYICVDDGKPTKICNNCFQYILNFKQLCDRCVKSDKMYNEILYNSINKENTIDLDKLKIKYEVIDKFNIENEGNNSLFNSLKIDQCTETNSLELNESYTKEEKVDPIFYTKTKTEEEDNSLQADGLQNVEVQLKSEIEYDNFSFLGTNSKCNSSYPSTSNNESSKSSYENVPPTKRKELNKTSVKKKHNRNEEGIFKCEKCDKIFTKRSNYQYHLKSKHAGIKLFCSKCPKFFSTKLSLKNHEKVHLPDSEKMIHTCSYCNKKFSKAVNVKTHIKTIHINEREFICDECGKSFKTKAALQRHQLSHSDERPFQCPDCPKRFKSTAKLHIHSDHHSDTKYPCTKCGSIFNTKKSLGVHMIVHTDEKKYKCDFCGNEYKRYETLKDHLNSHIGFRHSCPFCDKTFAYRTNFRNHQKTVHPVEFAAAQLEAKLAREKEYT